MADESPRFQVDVDLLDEDDFTDGVYEAEDAALVRAKEIVGLGVARKVSNGIYMYGPTAIRKVIIRPAAENKIN